MNKREIWGKLVRYKRAWTPGENEATEVAFSRDALIEGQKLSAGKYTLIVIPTETEWTLIFSKVLDQYAGLAVYDPEFDALRVVVKPQHAEHHEWLTYEVENFTGTRQP